jgi:hypothetical protein
MNHFLEIYQTTNTVIVLYVTVIVYISCPFCKVGLAVTFVTATNMFWLCVQTHSSLEVMSSSVNCFLAIPSSRFFTIQISYSNMWILATFVTAWLGYGTNQSSYASVCCISPIHCQYQLL